ncbi:BlaI/MecI/CopY family transcriptional regulator [Planctomicrobium sp. SH664]|uniref:BlaI/MecI/CopY family transcriptional regulator n=1 Tax=Planctomicrobium sp. SH664 TaxID=3448125 RepID=UPI003F5B9323
MVALTKGELEIMDVIWNRGQSTVQEVCDALERPLAYTTVMTVLKTLELKRGAVRKVKVGRAFVYESVVSRDEVSQTMLGQLKQHLSRRSVKSFVLSLIQDDHISRSDLAEIKNAIARLEGEK